MSPTAASPAVASVEPVEAPAERARFYGPAVFEKVLDRYDVGIGDRFYDSPKAYERRWGEAHVTFATLGELGAVRFVVERRLPGIALWARSDEQCTTQRDFRQLIELLP